MDTGGIAALPYPRARPIFFPLDDSLCKICGIVIACNDLVLSFPVPDSRYSKLFDADFMKGETGARLRKLAREHVHPKRGFESR